MRKLILLGLMALMFSFTHAQKSSITIECFSCEQMNASDCDDCNGSRTKKYFKGLLIKTPSGIYDIDIPFSFTRKGQTVHLKDYEGESVTFNRRNTKFRSISALVDEINGCNCATSTGGGEGGDVVTDFNYNGSTATIITDLGSYPVSINSSTMETTTSITVGTTTFPTGTDVQSILSAMSTLFVNDHLGTDDQTLTEERTIDLLNHIMNVDATGISGDTWAWKITDLLAAANGWHMEDSGELFVRTNGVNGTDSGSMIRYNPGTKKFIVSGVGNGTYLRGDSMFIETVLDTDNTNTQALTVDPVSKELEMVDMVNLNAMIVDSIPDLLQLLPGSINICKTIRFNSQVIRGGNIFVWSASMPKTEHNGGSIIDPDIIFPIDWENEAQKTTWFTPALSGFGCWVSIDKSYNSSQFGAYEGYIDNNKQVAMFLSNIPRGTIGLLHNGTYNVDPLILYSNTILKGENKESTVLKLKDQTQTAGNLTHNSVLSNEVILSAEFGGNGNRDSLIHISNLTVDGNKDFQSSFVGSSEAEGIGFKGVKNCFISDVIVKNVVSDGIDMDYCDNVSIKNAIVYNIGKTGIHVSSGGPQGVSKGCNNISVDGARISFTTGCAINDAYIGGEGRWNKYVNIEADSCGQEAGYSGVVGFNSQNVYVNNIIVRDAKDQATAGFGIQGDSAVLNNIRVERCNVGINISTADYATLQNATVYDCDSYGIETSGDYSKINARTFNCSSGVRIRIADFSDININDKGSNDAIITSGECIGNKAIVTSENSGNAVHLGGTVTGITLEVNALNCTSHAVYSSGVINNANIKINRIDGATNGVYTLATFQNSKIYGGVIKNVEDGVSLNNPLAMNNTVSNLEISASSDGVILKNTENGYNVIRNNLIRSSDTGILLTATTGEDCSYNRVEYNTILAATVKGISLNTLTSNNTVAYNTIKDSSPAETTDLEDIGTDNKLFHNYDFSKSSSFMSVVGGSTSFISGSPERLDEDTPGVTEDVSSSSDWTVSGSTMTYTGTETKNFEVSSIISASLATQGSATYYIAKNGTFIAAGKRRDHGNSDVGVVAVSWIVSMSTSDTLEVQIDADADETCNVSTYTLCAKEW